MRTMIRDTVFMATHAFLMAANTLLIMDNAELYWLLLILICLQGFFFVGIMEAFHQSVHANLFAYRPANNFFGYLAGSFMGLSFVAYKRFHIIHHATTNTHKDPEKNFYAVQAPLLGVLLYPFVFLVRNANIINKGNYLKEGDVGSHRLAMTLIVLFRVASLVLTVFYPYIMLLTYWLPYVIFFYVELILSQSQHYLSEERMVAPRQKDQYRDAINILLPWPLEFACLYTNHHATHHVYAGAKWYAIPGKTKADGNLVVNIGFFSFFKRCLEQGARRWKSAT